MILLAITKFIASGLLSWISYHSCAHKVLTIETFSKRLNMMIWFKWFGTVYCSESPHIVSWDSVVPYNLVHLNMTAIVITPWKYHPLEVLAAILSRRRSWAGHQGVVTPTNSGQCACSEFSSTITKSHAVFIIGWFCARFCDSSQNDEFLQTTDQIGFALNVNAPINI